MMIPASSSPRSDSPDGEGGMLGLLAGQPGQRGSGRKTMATAAVRPKAGAVPTPAPAARTSRGRPRSRSWML
jgi:hypothetical protein